jgi:hypothetical protein
MVFDIFILEGLHSLIEQGLLAFINEIYFANKLVKIIPLVRMD